MNILTLHLRTEYFNQIKQGTKTEEYRLVGMYWRQRLFRRNYDEVHVLLGYPGRENASRCLVFPWQGYEIKTITHPHFGTEPVEVYAIKVQADLIKSRKEITMPDNELLEDDIRAWRDRIAKDPELGFKINQDQAKRILEMWNEMKTNGRV